MTWRTAIGLTPTPIDLAEDLLRAAERHGLAGWRHDVAGSALRNGDQVVNISNIGLEYSRASRLARRDLLQKYLELLQTPPVSKLWTLAQAKIYPLLRSRYDRLILEINSRGKPDGIPPRIARHFIGDLEQVLGYDQGRTISQVKAEFLDAWGVSLDAAMDRALQNLRALAPPAWNAIAAGLWELNSPGGYTESLLQVFRIFDSLPARGTPLVMIPSRGGLLATGMDEPDGLSALLAAAIEAIRHAPWPLSPQLLRVTPAGVESHQPEAPDARTLLTVRQFDLSGVYDGQKTALQAHYDALGDAVFVASYTLTAPTAAIDEVSSLCSWARGAPSLLPITDTIAFSADVNGTRELIQVPWTDAERLVGHYFKPTTEDPPRVRVDEFPTPEEWESLKQHAQSV